MSDKWINDTTGETVQVTGISKCGNFVVVKTADGVLEYGWSAFLLQHTQEAV